MSETHDHDHDHHGDAEAEADCQAAIAALYTFLDGHLTDDKRSSIQQHLDLCSPCLEAFEFESELRFVVAHRCKEEVPESLRQKVADVLGDLAPSDFDGAQP